MKIIEKAHIFANKNKGICLSKKYINEKTKMAWKCEHGHRWNTYYKNICRGKWCPKCGGTKRKTIKDAQKLAIINKGSCLSKKYLNNRTKMLWKCSYGHQWKSIYNKIQQGAWCPYCSGTVRNTIKDAQKIAIRNKGKCLSTKYDNAHTKILWECEHNHRWFATYNNIRCGKWCRNCAGLKLKTIEEAQQVAIERNGLCLSEKYINSKTHLLWKCKNNHIWKATFNNVGGANKTWCPKCKSSKKQKKIYDIIIDLFPNCIIYYNFRGFSWLKTNHGKLEIDIFIIDKYKNFSLAIEYDGEQHFRPINFGGISNKQALKEFKKLKKRDKLKNKKIAQNIKDIKYFIRFNYKEDIEKEYIIQKLKKNGIKIL